MAGQTTGLVVRGSITGREKKSFSSAEVQTGSRTQTTPYSMRTRGSFPGGIAVGAWI